MTVILNLTVTQEDIDSGMEHRNSKGRSYLCPVAHAVTVAVNTNEDFQAAIGRLGASTQARVDTEGVWLESAAMGSTHAFAALPWKVRQFIRDFDRWSARGWWDRWLNRDSEPKPFDVEIEFDGNNEPVIARVKAILKMGQD